MKTCFKCKVQKPFSEFYKHKQMADGYLNKCKSCAKSDAWHNRRDNIDRYREYDRERAKRHERIAATTIVTSAYRKKYPKRYKANTAVGNALRDGILEKQPCWCCGDTQVDAHHADYDKPLEVVWLCPAHHKEIHLAYPDDYYERTNV